MTTAIGLHFFWQVDNETTYLTTRCQNHTHFCELENEIPLDFFIPFKQPGSISDERRSSLGCDYQGRPYEDMYQVIVHEERRDDWSPVIVMLKKHFIQYPESLKNEGFPEGCLSSASEGNFLEVLNMGANGGYFLSSSVLVYIELS